MLQKYILMNAIFGTYVLKYIFIVFSANIYINIIKAQHTICGIE